MFWQRYLCYDAIKTMLFVIMAVSFVLFGIQISLFWWRCLYWDVVKRRYLLPISILYTTMLSKQGHICCNIAEVMLIVVVLLKQYYSSYNIANSRCSGLKVIGSMLFVSENCQSNTVLLEYHWRKVILYNVVPAVCPSMMLLNQAQIYSCGCYLV